MIIKEPTPKIYKRRCLLCNKSIQSQSQQSLVKKYYTHLEECKRKFLKEFHKET